MTWDIFNLTWNKYVKRVVIFLCYSYLHCSEAEGIDSEMCVNSLKSVDESVNI